MMTWEEGGLSKSVDLPGELNSTEWEAHAQISPDGTYMLFDRVESTFVSFRNEDGTWDPGIDLRMKLHIPCVSPDGKYIFFESDGDIWWVDAKVIEWLRPKNDFIEMKMNAH